MITAILVTYNRLEKLKITVERTLAQDALDSLLILDNASSDGTRIWLDSLQDKRVIVHHNEENTGGAGGFSLGMQLALEKTSSEWFVLYDDDAYPEENAFAKFRELTEEQNFDGAAAAVYYPDGTICEMNRPSWDPFRHPKKLRQTILSVLGIGKKREAFHVPNSAYQEQKSLSIDSSSFVGFFIKSEWVARLPPLNPDLFIYGDDMLYSLVFTKAGGKHLFLSTVKFNHACTVSKEDKNEFYVPMWKAYFAYRNGLILYRYVAGKWFYPISLLKMCQWLAAVRKYGNKKDYLKLWMSACRDGMIRNFEVNPLEIMKKYR